MSVNISGTYLGDLTCEATHGPSGAKIQTTAPLDNGGRGDMFSPTDLCATSIGVCMLTIIGQWAMKYAYDVKGSTFRLEKHMGTDPRRIAHVPMVFEIRGNVPEDKRVRLEAAAMACPVKKSLADNVAVDVTWVYV
jgi:putative redox protein